ncbi:HNH endonuclease [Zobellia nedashkovskayae]|uniref:HNH endonuclease n=1 Tax=Zobellia nedashkovskayae TaxID=2779510 RepID=UPI00188BB7B7|nr:HNH endonuclease [Zobellia nedashkovskayae]
MIKIKTNKTKANDFAKSFLKPGAKFALTTKIDNWLAANPGHRGRGMFNYIKNNIEHILKAEPKELEKIIQEFLKKGYQKKILTKKGKLNKLGKEIEIIFNYKGFRESKRAILLAQSLKIKSCTYCNSQYSLTVEHNGKTKLLFHLDHFFPKSTYPYLSLSYYNLIPCCASCNMSKSNKPYQIKENIHPYIDSLDEIAKYEATYKSLALFLLDINKNENDIELQLNVRKKFLGDLKTENKLNNYKNEFKVETQYQQFKDVVGETYLKGLYYNNYRKKELTDFFKKKKGISLTQEMIHRFIVGNYTENKDLLKRPLAKMMKDISEDFKLI